MPKSIDVERIFSSFHMTSLYHSLLCGLGDNKENIGDDGGGGVWRGDAINGEKKLDLQQGRCWELKQQLKLILIAIRSCNSVNLTFIEINYKSIVLRKLRINFFNSPNNSSSKLETWWTPRASSVLTKQFLMIFVHIVRRCLVIVGASFSTRWIEGFFYWKVIVGCVAIVWFRIRVIVVTILQLLLLLLLLKHLLLKFLNIKGLNYES